MKVRIQISRPEELSAFIKKSHHGGVFADPLGFLVPLNEFSRDDKKC